MAYHLLETIKHFSVILRRPIVTVVAAVTLLTNNKIFLTDVLLFKVASQVLFLIAVESLEYSLWFRTINTEYRQS